MTIFLSDKNCQKDDDDLPEPPFSFDDFPVLFFEVSLSCDSANFFILEVFDFFDTAIILVKGYWFWVKGFGRESRGEIFIEQKYNI